MPLLTYEYVFLKQEHQRHCSFKNSDERQYSSQLEICQSDLIISGYIEA